MKCPTCEGSGKFPSAYQICGVCSGNGELPNDRIDNRDCPVCSGCGKYPNLYTVCEKCDGWGKLRESAEQGPLVVFVKAGTPRTAHRNLQGVFSGLNGDIRICDPYFGTGSLAKLDLLTHCSSIRFLTKRPDTNEKTFIARVLRDFISEYPHVEIRKAQGDALHDRFILTSDEFILFGHGLKDVGGRDSFIVRLGRHLAGDVITTISQAFDEKWEAGIPFP